MEGFLDVAVKTVDDPQLRRLALADLGRWMSGWGWWGHDLSHRIKPLLDTLDGGKPLASEEAYREAVWRVYPEGAV